MRRLTTRFLFVRGCLLVAALIALSVACATDQTTDSQPVTPPVAEPETVGKMVDGAEQTDARRGSTGEETTFDNGLECTGGMAVSGIGDYAPGAEGKEADPVEQTRRAFSGQIRKGDRVGLSATPQRGDQRTVRVVREGRTVALIVYRRAGGGWLRDSHDAYAGFAGF
jgi:hypothetical protein